MTFEVKLNILKNLRINYVSIHTKFWYVKKKSKIP